MEGSESGRATLLILFLGPSCSMRSFHEASLSKGEGQAMDHGNRTCQVQVPESWTWQESRTTRSFSSKLMAAISGITCQTRTAILTVVTRHSCDAVLTRAAWAQRSSNDIGLRKRRSRATRHGKPPTGNAGGPGGRQKGKTLLADAISIPMLLSSLLQRRGYNNFILRTHHLRVQTGDQYQLSPVWTRRWYVRKMKLL